MTLPSLSDAILALSRRATRRPRARKRYKPEVKAKIIEASTAARAAGKPWKDAHVAAQQAGYKGNVDNLMKMMARKTDKRHIRLCPNCRGRKS